MFVTAAPPFVFWNLLGLLSFHLGMLCLLQRRLRRCRLAELSAAAMGEAVPTVLVAVPLAKLDSQDIAAVRALLRQQQVSYRLLLCLDGALGLSWNQHQNGSDQNGFSHPDTAVDLFTNTPAVQQLLLLQQEAHQLGIELDILGLDRLPSNWITAPFESRAIALAQQWLASASPDISPVEVLAVMSPQLTPAPNWLYQLVAPLANPAIAATTAYPWQFPMQIASANALGKRSAWTNVRLAWVQLLQYAWNGFAVQQLVMLPRTIWSGAIALRVGCLAPARLQRWQQLGASDIALGQMLHQEQLKLMPVLRLMAHRRSLLPTATLGSEIRQRLNQLKQHSPLWLILAAQGLFVSGTTLRAYAQVLRQAMGSAPAINLWLLLAIALYAWTISSLLLTLEAFVRTRSQPRVSPTMKSLFLCLWMIAPLAQLLHCLTTVWVLLPEFLKAKFWRHILFTQPIHLRKS